MSFFHEDGRGGIVDESGNEAAAFVVESSFRLTNLTNLQKYIKHKKVIVDDEPKDTDMQEAPPKKERISTYNTYTDEDRRRYFYFIHERLLKPSEAARLANVNPETARKWKRAYKNDPENKIPLKKTTRTSNRVPSRLNEQHKAYLVDFFDENPTAVIQDAVENLTRSFEGLEIKKSRVAEFMKEDCNLSIKVITRHPKARNSPKTIEARAKWVEEWLQKGLLYMQNCVFLDETGFDINMRRTRGWSTRGKPAVVESPSARGVSHTVIGAISAAGVINVSLREPGNVKKRKVVGARKRKEPGDSAAAAIPKGTTAGHYAQFISDTLDIMDEHPEMKGYHIVMDNAPIHIPTAIDPIILGRGYIPVYLPPYSPELNPIEMFWKVLKDHVRRTLLTATESLTLRIIEGSENVPLEHIQNFIQHSINVFPKCLNKEPL